VITPGWIAMPENISKLIAEMENKAPSLGVFVFNLLGNTAIRYKQYDKTTSLPFKSQARLHLGGKDAVSLLDQFKKTLESIIPVLNFLMPGKKYSVLLSSPPPPCLAMFLLAVAVIAVRPL
jgi:hypothetical protein